MSDIAKEAGIVRQTLYSFFKSKDEILCASIRHYSALSLSKIKAEWETVDNLEEKLEVFFDHAIISSFAVISASADARDMIGGYNALGRAEIEQVQAEKIIALSEMLSKYQVGLDCAGQSADQLAEYIMMSSTGIRDQAHSEQQLRKLLAVMKNGVIALIGSK